MDARGDLLGSRRRSTGSGRQHAQPASSSFLAYARVERAVLRSRWLNGPTTSQWEAPQAVGVGAPDAGLGDQDRGPLPVRGRPACSPPAWRSPGCMEGNEAAPGDRVGGRAATRLPGLAHRAEDQLGAGPLTQQHPADRGHVPQPEGPARRGPSARSPRRRRARARRRGSPRAPMSTRNAGIWNRSKSTTVSKHCSGDARNTRECTIARSYSGMNWSISNGSTISARRRWT